MPTPIKGNEEIRADDAAFKAAVARARTELGRIEGVVGVGFGVKERAGLFGDEVAILVYVAEKRPDDELAPAGRIPATFDGYRTDVRVMQRAREDALICGDNTRREVMVGGINIEARGAKSPKESVFGGTLGCIVRKRGDSGDDNVYLLTCHHVLLSDKLKTTPGDGVYQPYFPRPGTEYDGVQIGVIDKALARNGHVQADGKPVANEPDASHGPLLATIDPNFDGIYVDCGAVQLQLGSFCCGSACTPNGLSWAPTIPSLNILTSPPGGVVGNLDRVVDVRDLRKEPAASVAGMRVVKNGVRSARSVGRIVGIGPAHSILNLPDGPIVIAFRYNVIEIALFAPPPAKNGCTNENEFGAEGDSGSLVVDDLNRAVGLYYGGTFGLNAAGARMSHACLIVPVLDTLGMCIPCTTGTSHGSSLATDGSGLASAGPLELPQDPAKTLFAAGAVAGSPARVTVTIPPPPTDEQRARMLPLLQALRTTERGRQLHEDFSQLSREIAHLVRRNRAVKVAWQRARGPAFLVHALNHLRGDAASVPLEVGGVTRTELLARMDAMLCAHGSNPLRDAIERHRELLMACAEAHTAPECIDILRRAEIEVSA